MNPDGSPKSDALHSNKRFKITHAADVQEILDTPEAERTPWDNEFLLKHTEATAVIRTKERAKLYRKKHKDKKKLEKTAAKEETDDTTNNDLTVVETSDMIRNNECKTCGKNFSLAGNLKRHEKLHERESNRDLVECSGEGMETKQWYRHDEIW